MNSRSRALLCFAVSLAGCSFPAWAQVEWRRAPVLVNRTYASMAYDASRDRIVQFGGFTYMSVRQFSDETWEWDGSAWSLRSPSVSPAPRSGHGMAYDAARRRVVLFGGRGASGAVLDDTWEWDGATWMQQTPLVRPAARTAVALAGDSGRGRVVLFGGNAGSWSSTFDDTWEWDGASWSQVAAPGPIARGGHAMTYDAARGRTLMFGGTNAAGSHLGDTWEWNGASWTLRTTPTAPPAQSFAPLAFDSLRGVAILVGGVGGLPTFPPRFYPDTWEWDGTTWTQRVANHAALGREAPALAFDGVRGRAVLFGGVGSMSAAIPHDPSSTWGWDGTSWSELAPEASPGRRRAPTGNMEAVAYDPVRQGVVGFGGLTEYVWSEAWSWDGLAWTRSPVVTNPPGRSSYALATDPLRNRVVLFGGIGQGALPLADTWEWDGATWSQRNPSASPSARANHAMTWYSARSRVVLFGGTTGAAMNDLWEWDGNTWSLRSTPQAPTPRYSSVMAEDEARGVVVLFGGSTNSGFPNDTWEWDGTSWTLRAVAGPTVANPSVPWMTYDRARRRVVLNVESASQQYETWEWDGIRWMRRVTAPAIPYENGTMAYDPVRRRIVQYNGAYTWEYGPTHPATFQQFGTGCAGSAGTPQLNAVGGPWLGDIFTLSLTALPSNAAAMLIVGDSRTSWLGLPLPLDLTGAGMTGCALYANGLAVLPAQANGSTAALPIRIPRGSDLLGASFFTQGFALDPAANALGITATNAGEGRIGGR